MTWRGEFHKQVLAIGPHTLTGHASEVDRGVPGHLNRCFRHHLARHPLQAFGELVDGITFRHGAERTGCSGLRELAADSAITHTARRGSAVAQVVPPQLQRVAQRVRKTEHTGRAKAKPLGMFPRGFMLIDAYLIRFTLDLS